MPAFHFRPLAQCCYAHAALLFVLLSIVACDDTRSPPPPTDPGSVARRVVAEFMSLPMDDVILVSLQAQDFNNSSLGCPQSGMAYQQVITPGHRAMVEADGRRFDVRVAGGHGRICRNHQRRNPQTDSDRQTSLTTMIDAARNDLAGRLGITAAKISVLDIRPTAGKNLPIGCTLQCDESDKSCGYMIGLFHQGRRYDYHAADGSAAPCPAILRM